MGTLDEQWIVFRTDYSDALQPMRAVAIGLFQNRVQPCAAIGAHVQDGRLCKPVGFSCVQLLAVMRRETWVLFETAPFDHSGTPPTSICRHSLVSRGGCCSGLFQNWSPKRRLGTKNAAQTTTAGHCSQGGQRDRRRGRGCVPNLLQSRGGSASVYGKSGRPHAPSLQVASVVVEGQEEERTPRHFPRLFKADKQTV